MATQLSSTLIFSILSLLLFLLFLHKWISESSTPKKNPPPSPPRLPIIGNLHQLGLYPHRSLSFLSKKYGDLMLLHFGSKPTIVVSSAEVASQVLKTHDLIFASRPELRSYRRILANGKEILTSPYGEYWRQMKSMCVQHLLSSQRILSFRKAREEEVALMVKSIEGAAKPVNLSAAFASLSSDVISRAAFGKKYGGEESGAYIKEMVNELTQLLGCYCIGDFVGWLAWIDKISGTDAKIGKSSKKIDGILERILKDHLVCGRDVNEDGGGESRSDYFVDALVKAQREGGSASSFLDNESIKGLILDMFAGGTDTTYMVLEWTMSELLRSTRIMEKLKQEVRKFTGTKEMVTEDELENMVYLKAVIKEGLRLHPPAPVLAPHESTEDVKISGYDIVAGTQLMVNVWSISRDPAYWDEPDSFYPERFIDSPIDFRGQSFQFIPFGSGRRSCPGITFGIAIIELAIANLLFHYDLMLPNGVDEVSLDMTEVPGLAVHRKNPLLAIPIPRFA